MFKQYNIIRSNNNIFQSFLKMYCIKCFIHCISLVIMTVYRVLENNYYAIYNIMLLLSTPSILIGIILFML